MENMSAVGTPDMDEGMTLLYSCLVRLLTALWSGAIQESLKEQDLFWDLVKQSGKGSALSDFHTPGRQQDPEEFLSRALEQMLHDILQRSWLLKCREQVRNRRVLGS